jgi:hypothetical protein
MKIFIACLFLLTALCVSGCQSPGPQLDPQRVQTLVSFDAGGENGGNDAYKPSDQMTRRTRAAAVAVLATLDAAQREKATRPIKDPLRKDWHFVPRSREGLPMGEMSVEQRTLVHELMQTALSDSGYLKATDIIWLETVLAEMENRPEYRDAGKYALIIFGDPADEKAAWGWRLEGHHLSINLTYAPEGIGVTPLFFGTNPAVVQQGALAGKRVLGDAHHLAVQLAKSMTAEQREKMMLANKPRDVITGPGREKALKEVSGLSANHLDLHQLDLLYRLVNAHAGSFENEHMLLLMQRAVRLDSGAPMRGFSIAWAGPVDVGQPFYYRIHNENFVIEYSCQGKNHVHCVIHDLTDPLQEDLLKKHFEQHEHE